MVTTIWIDDYSTLYLHVIFYSCLQGNIGLRPFGLRCSASRYVDGDTLDGNPTFPFEEGYK